MNTIHPMKFGIYDHYKGGVYLACGISTWESGSCREPVVEYTSMTFGTRHARLLTQWNEMVTWPDGEKRSRFVYRGADLTTPEPSFKVPSPVSSSRLTTEKGSLG